MPNFHFHDQRVRAACRFVTRCLGAGTYISAVDPAVAPSKLFVIPEYVDNIDIRIIIYAYGVNAVFLPNLYTVICRQHTGSGCCSLPVMRLRVLIDWLCLQSDYYLLFYDSFMVIFK